MVATIRGTGMHWQSIGPFVPRATHLKGVRFGGEMFVAWADHTLVFTRDGVRWGRGEGFPLTAQINAVAYGNDRFVAVGKTGHISVSKDGAHWNTQLISGSAAFSDVAYGAGLFVAAGVKGVIATSPDGETWTFRSATSEDLTMIAFGNSRFVASARASDGRTPAGFVISTDGIQWEYIPPAPLYAEMNCQTAGCKTATLAGGLIFHEGKFVLLTFKR